jgi:tRNA U34 5-carboxymethylaminomethyl modifying enzyme MnmG/GidA
MVDALDGIMAKVANEGDSLLHLLNRRKGPGGAVD